MEITEEDQLLFQQSCEKVIKQEREQHGIGTLGEKTIHAVLKYYLEPRKQYHEQRIGRFVADILSDGEIIEIQTGGFDKLRRKLEVFLEEYDVTVVYPIPAQKWISWIDEESGEVRSRRKSPRPGFYEQAFAELYKIKPYLKNPRLHVRLFLIDMEEYRLLNGWSHDKKRGSTRFDRIPLRLSGERMIAELKDYQSFIPETLPDQFVSKEYHKETKLTLNRAQTALNILSYVGAVKRVGKQGRSLLYEREGLKIRS